ncbi:MAG: pentapeptide repeat-containing protein [Armatimonadota bacterium]
MAYLVIERSGNREEIRRVELDALEKGDFAGADLRQCVFRLRPTASDFMLLAAIGAMAIAAVGLTIAFDPAGPYDAVSIALFLLMVLSLSLGGAWYKLAHLRSLSFLALFVFATIGFAAASRDYVTTPAFVPLLIGYLVLSSIAVWGMKRWGRREKPASMRSANLAGADLTGIQIEIGSGMALSHADLTGARIEGGKLVNVDLRDARLDGALMNGIRIHQSRLQNASLEGASLANAEINRCRLDGANLCRADLRQAAMKSVDARGANLEEADLRGADLRYSQLVEANLSGARLEGADLRWTSLRGARLDGITHDTQTRWPRGFTPPA